MSDMMIAQCPLFAALSPEECRVVSEIMTPHQFAAGDSVLREGDETATLHLLTTGTCVVSKQMAQEKVQELDTLEQGAIFGEISFFCPGPHSATVTATTEAVTFALTREKFALLQHERPSAALKITLHATSMLAARLRRMDEWTCELVNKNTPAHEHHEWHQFRAQLYSEWNF